MDSWRSRLCKTVAVLAMVLQSFAVFSASLMGCCVERQACCLLPATGAVCASCTPVPVAPESVDTPLVESEPVDALPAVARPLPDKRVDEIWRPPINASFDNVSVSFRHSIQRYS